MTNQIMLLLVSLLMITCQQAPPESAAPPPDAPEQWAQLGQLLDSIHTEDQQYRAELDSIANKYGWQSAEMGRQWKKIAKTDSTNLILVEDILAKHGWLSAEQIGKKANSTLFLVIQHADQATQEKYLPLMREAVAAGKANSQSLALLEDRVALGKGELQIYGSQIGQDMETEEMYVLPLIDPDQVNERRAEVGLGTIEEYLANWNLTWDAEAYKQKLPDWIEKQKAQRR